MTDATQPVLDRATVAKILGKLDPTLSQASFDALVNAAGADEQSALQSVFDTVRSLVLGDASAFDPAKVGDIVDKIQAAIDGGVHGHIVSLVGMAAADITKLAEGDMGARYSLAHLLSFSITGNDALYERANADGSLFKFDPNTGERLLSDEYFHDRSTFLTVKLGAHPGDTSVALQGDQSWNFEDRSLNAVGGGHLRFAASGNDPDQATHRMVFGNDNPDGENIAGGNAADRLYGGAGDDSMRGGAGDDYMEGGRGNDFLQGGRGNDTLIGGEGEDELDGGAGDDHLAGGSGADDLTGGAGDDRLEGGAGFDTYNIDSGDGSDLIIDSDGKGVVLFDGQAITGAELQDDGSFKSADGNLTFSFAGDSVEGGTLTIAGAGNTIRIHDFRNGELGIKFGDGSAAALEGLQGAPTGTHSHTPDGLPIQLPDGGGGGGGDSGDGAPVAPPPDPKSNSLPSAPGEEPRETVPLFASTEPAPAYIGNDHVSQAIAQSANAIAPANFTDWVTQAVDASAVAPNLGVSPADVANALAAFHDATSDAIALGSEAAAEFTLGFDELAARGDKAKAGKIGLRIALDSKQPEIGLGSVGLGEIGLDK